LYCFWLGQNISFAGTAVTAVVLPILIFQRTGSPLQTSLTAAIQVLPYLFFGLVAGAIADRVNRKQLMIVCDLLNLILLGSLPIADEFGALTLPHIYIVALLSATAFVWFDTANFGALPAIVGRERLVEANSLMWATNTIISIVGPAVGGALAATLGPAKAITLDSFSYLLSAGSLILIARNFNIVSAVQAEAISLWQRTTADIREGLRFLWRQELVRALTLLGFGSSLTSGAVTGLMVVYGVKALSLPQADPRLGLLFTAQAVGSLVASVALPQLVRRVPVGRITLAAMLFYIVMLLGFIVAGNLTLGLVFCGLLSICNTLVVLNGISLRQMVTPESLMSRVNATARMVAWGGTPFGAALGGLLAEWLDIRVALLIMMTGAIVSAVVGWWSPLREGKVIVLEKSV
jgi:MFS family permease